MAPEKSEASAKAGPGVLLGGEHLISTPSGAERQPKPPSPLSEFQAQTVALAARLRMSEAVAGVVLYHLRGGRG